MSDLDAVFDLIDRITCLDIGRRGVAGLYEPARARNDEALCAAAARPLAGLSRGDHVIILTGSLTRANVSPDIAENDGPMGVAVLARAITHGFNAIPIIVVDESICDKVSAVTRVAGPNVVTLDQARIAVDTPRYTSIAVVQGGHIDDDAARARASAPTAPIGTPVVRITAPAGRGWTISCWKRSGGGSLRSASVMGGTRSAWGRSRKPLPLIFRMARFCARISRPMF